MSYDAGTAASVELFQRRRGLHPDGVVGPVTTMALNGDLGGAKAATLRLRAERLRDKTNEKRERRMATMTENERAEARERFLGGETAPPVLVKLAGHDAGSSRAGVLALLENAVGDGDAREILRESITVERRRRGYSTAELKAALGIGGGS